uniref:Chemokine interleukin-8-like domain-containing protein n=1 Tax=Suricata suricatta TaxID=37032 RepID=A0A673VBU6_SURSU
MKIFTLPKFTSFSFLTTITLDPLYTETVPAWRPSACSVAQATSFGQHCSLECFKGTIPVRKLMMWYRTSAECPGDAIVVLYSDPKDKKRQKVVRFLQSLMKSQGSVNQWS